MGACSYRGDERGKRERGDTCGMKECVRDNVCMRVCVCFFFFFLCLCEFVCVWLRYPPCGLKKEGLAKWNSPQMKRKLHVLPSSPFVTNIASHGPRLLLEIAGTLALFLAFQLHPPHSLFHSSPPITITPSAIFVLLFHFSCHRFNYSTYFFLLCGTSLVPIPWYHF